MTRGAATVGTLYNYQCRSAAPTTITNYENGNAKIKSLTNLGKTYVEIRVIASNNNNFFSLRSFPILAKYVKLQHSAYYIL